MATSLFSTSDDFFTHVIAPRPLTLAARDAVLDDFSHRGYIARQEPTGISVISKFMIGNIYTALSEGAADAPGHVQVVMIAHPTQTDDEFDSWVDVVQSWSAALPARTQVAISRKIRQLKHVERGVPLSILHDGLPDQILLSYRRPSEFVAVIEGDSTSHRSIYATKGIG
ncbi:hypothetical protein [Agreia pratensis]|uniref:Uncharacterized protein n=1 Tax=Agreia pratensis TaxID=150121 RepID=A0A1X7JXI0_9MICO|nr:hypothetical protein [Agreia pratensis]SMG32568.1 hypothetical protein SAMN06296010_1921 [Agreia pratensis]